MKKYANEIQIEIDDVYGCPGSCKGCALSITERKNKDPDMNIKLLELSIDKINNYIKKLNHLEKINLTYGIADHLIMDSEYLESIYRTGTKLFLDNNLNNGTNSIFFSASLIGKTEHIVQKLEKLYLAQKECGVPASILAVLDPKHLYHKSFGETYANNIKETKKMFNVVDLSINLSEETIHNITPEHLAEFAEENGFEEVTVNWVPTFDNINDTYFNQKTLSDWLIKFYECIKAKPQMSSSYQPVIKKTIDNIYCGEIINLSELIEKNLTELVYKSIQIDHSGFIFPKFEAIGDIGHNPRLGLKAWGKIDHEVDLYELIEKNIHITKEYIIKSLSNKNCLGCPHLTLCGNSGFHAYNYVIDKCKKFNPKVKQVAENSIKEGQCLHVARAMFDYFVEEYRR